MLYIAEGLTPCQESDPEAWHDANNPGPAVRLCRTCPERMPCLASALHHEQTAGRCDPAIYGGCTRPQRARLIKLGYQP